MNKMHFHVFAFDFDGTLTVGERSSCDVQIVARQSAHRRVSFMTPNPIGIEAQTEKSGNGEKNCSGVFGDGIAGDLPKGG